MDITDQPASDNKGPTLLASVYSLHAIALIVFMVRLWCRLRPKYAMTAADYTISVALVARCGSVGLTTAAVVNGFGRHTIHIPRSGLAVLGNLLFANFLCSSVALGFARISIACMLLQVAMSRRSRVAIWATIILQVAVMLMYIIAQLVQCNSVLARKIKIQESQCLTPSQIWSYTYASTSIAIFSDLLCAIIPICLIKSLTRSPVEKVLVSILLGFCLLGSGACIARIYYMVVFDFSSPDGFYLMVDRFIWSRAEESLMIIAACAPLMKSPVERLLKRLGLAQGFSVPRRELNKISDSSSGNGTESNCGDISVKV